MVTVHYHRFDADYEGVRLHTWDKTGRRTPTYHDLSPAGWDDFGPYFEFDPALYGESEFRRAVGFLLRIHNDWSRKDGFDRFWSEDLGNHIWLIGGDREIYTSEPDISPRVQAAYIDGHNLLTVRLSHGIELGRLVPNTFQVRCANGSSPRVTSIRALNAAEGRASLVELTTGEELDCAHHLMVLPEGYRPGEAVMRNRLHDREEFFADVELGAICTPEATTFRVFAPTARRVEVILYDDPTGDAGRRVVEMARGLKGIWETVQPGDLHGRHYMLRVDADGPLTHREVVDIYCRCTTGHDGRGKIVDLRRTDPEGFRPVRRPDNITHPTDAIVWEVSLRDLTRNPNSGVPGNVRGKYLGATLRGTVLPGTDIRTGLDHIAELGVTHVQILPIQDFDNRETTDEYNWGYMTSNFFSPDGWFASNHRDTSRITEFKQVVKAFHDAGIRVIMDVVYNHTGIYATFESIVPGYYHRRREDGTYWNGSGCGNEFRSEAPMARKFIVDSCRYWAEEYGVDGFRFDLMGLIDLETMRAVRDAMHQIDPTILVYGEPWAAAPQEDVGLNPITYKHVVAGTGIGAFNDHFRNDLKGYPDGSEPGFVQSGLKREGVKKGIAASLADWAASPTEVIQYATCHDNLTLFDKLQLSVEGEVDENDIVRLQMLTVGILMVSQGIAFLHAGHEMARTKRGHHNSYNAPDDVNWIDWHRKQLFPQLFEYVRGMIALRRSHPVFRLPSRDEVMQRLFFHDSCCPTPSCLAFSLQGDGIAGETWSEVLCLINGSAEDQTFTLPPGDWGVYVQGELVSTSKLFRAFDRVAVFARTLLIAAR